jgi:hypothetical protein
VKLWPSRDDPLPLALGAIVRTAVWVDAPSLAVIVALCEEVTVVVEIVKFAPLWPAAILTDDGTWALELLDERVTWTPPAGAAAESVTVPVTEPPPVTALDDNIRGWMVTEDGGGVPATPVMENSAAPQFSTNSPAGGFVEYPFKT